MGVCDIFSTEMLSNSNLMQAYWVPDSVHFNQIQTADVPEPVPVHLWLDHTITNVYQTITFESLDVESSYLHIRYI